MQVEKMTIQRGVPWQLQNEVFGFVKLRASSKIPIEQGWQNNHHSFQEANSWIGQGFNCGVMGGRGDLIIIDADTPQIIDLVESNLPKTLTVKSPRKGAHFYFLCPDITKKIVLKKDGVHYGEIIASGSQVVGAGSIHPDTGTEYQVINDVEIARVSRENIYSALAACSIFDLPAKDKEAEIEHISVVDVLNKKNVQTKTIGDQIFCSHPVHGSTNGNNFVINPEKNVWHCFRCNTGGGALSLIAVLEGVIDCTQAVSGALRGDKFNQVLQIAQDQYGFEVKRQSFKEIPSGFFNDTWNADIFVKQHGQGIKNCDQLGGWYIWNSKVWQKDETHQIIKLADDTVKSFYPMASKFDDGSKEQKLFFQHIKLSGNENKMKAMINLARSHAQVSIVSDDFDANPYLLNCQNGIYDLKSDCFIEHSPDLMISKMCGASYDKEAKCPHWDEFLNTVFIGNKELINFIQKAVGYALTGDVSLQMFFILHGNGANGKSTFVDTINKMMGNYAASTPTTTLTVKRGDEIPNDVARLKGSRFVISSELERSKVLDEALVKRFTSDEPITARFLRKEFFEFKPTAKIFLSTNYKPTIKGTDDGIWRRIKLVPFEHKFTGEKKIEKYAEKFLFPELPGILCWAIEGYQKLRQDGLKEPDIVCYATSEYKSSEDTIAGYLDEFCVQAQPCRVLVLDLYNHFRENSEHFMRKKDFNDYLVKRGFIKEKGTYGNFKGRWTWFGIGLRSEAREIQEVDPRPF